MQLTILVLTHKIYGVVHFRIFIAILNLRFVGRYFILNPNIFGLLSVWVFFKSVSFVVALKWFKICLVQETAIHFLFCEKRILLLLAKIHQIQTSYL